MAINLKEILISDSDSIKLEKVNYNFDQLLAAGGGPKGPQGEKGDAGLQGITGQKGEIGPQGNQGPVGLKGDSGAELWYGVAGQFNNSVVSVHDPNDYPEPSNVLIGFNYQDAPYNSPNSDTSLLVNRSSYYGSNLRLSSSTVPGFFVDYTVEEANGIKKFKTISSNVAGSKFEWGAGEYNFYDYSTSNLLLSIAANNITTSIDSFFNEPATFNSSLTYNFGTPATGKVVASADSSGLFEWKYPDELGGVAPIGTIVGVLYDKWNDSNNFLGTSTPEVYDIDDDEILPILAGRGVGDYAGWYICNGQTWRNASNSFSYEVPDLNSFSYTIDDNSDSTDPNSQGAVSGSNNNLNLLGGIDLEMQATYDSNTGDYTISMTQSNGDDTIYAGTSGTSYVIKRVPQIIYLGETDLYWTAGSGQVSPPHGVTYTFEDTDNVIQDVTHIVTASAGDTTSINGGSMFTIPTVDDNGWAFTGPATFTGWPVNTPGITQYLSSDDTQLEVQIAGLTHPANTVTNVTIQYSSAAAGYAQIPQTTYVVNLVSVAATGYSPPFAPYTDLTTPGEATATFASNQTDADGNTLSGSTHTFVYDSASPADIEFQVEFDTSPNNDYTYRRNQSSVSSWIETSSVPSNQQSYSGSQTSNSWYYTDQTYNSTNGTPLVGTYNHSFSTCKATAFVKIDAADLPTDGQTHTRYVNMVMTGGGANNYCGVSLYGPHNLGWSTVDGDTACTNASTITNPYYTDTTTPWGNSQGQLWVNDTINNTWSLASAGWYSDGDDRRYWDGGGQGQQGWTGASTACPEMDEFGYVYRNDGVVIGYGGSSYQEYNQGDTPTTYANGGDPERQPGGSSNSTGLAQSWINSNGTWEGHISNACNSCNTTRAIGIILYTYTSNSSGTISYQYRLKTVSNNSYTQWYSGTVSVPGNHPGGMAYGTADSILVSSGQIIEVKITGITGNNYCQIYEHDWDLGGFSNGTIIGLP